MESGDLNYLSEEERLEYQRYMVSGKPPLSPPTAAKFYALYLQGYNITQIAKQNPGFGTGIIARACVDFDWEKQRLEHTKQLMISVQSTVTRSTLDAIQFSSDGMAVFHKLAGSKFRKYLQTGDESVLGDWANMNFKTYKDFVEVLLKLTDPEKKADSKTVIEASVNAPTAPPPADTAEPVLADDRPLTPLEAAEMLKKLGGF